MSAESVTEADVAAALSAHADRQRITELAEFSLDPVVDDSTAGETACKREDGTRVTVGEVAAAQARLLDLIAKRSRQFLKSGNPARRATGLELLELMGLDQ